MSQILIVEDENIIRSALRRLMERNGYNVSEAPSVHQALDRYDLKSFDLIITDLRLPGAPGTDLIKIANGIPVLVMTSYASVRSAVDSLKMGAVDYIAKPFDHDEMLLTVDKILREHANDLRNGGANTGAGLPGFIGSCNAMKDLYSRIRKVAPTTATVLIQGETGTGKELVAKALHELGKRSNQPLVSLNCAAIPETLIESELFGHEKGAFTGATSARQGLVEAADGGTLFLDEIGELPLEAQARLLRVLQEGELRRVGSTETKHVDVRMIAATHRDLATLSQTGAFRQDLFYRLNVVNLKVPPLRDRDGDIFELSEWLLEKYSKRLDRGALRFAADAIQAITTYAWPGNVRELENAIERATILSDGDEIHHEYLDIDIKLTEVPLGQPAASQIPHYYNGTSPSKPVNDPAENLSLEDYFQHFVMENQDSMTETELAKKLGISRKSLWERRQRLGIPRNKKSK